MSDTHAGYHQYFHSLLGWVLNIWKCRGSLNICIIQCIFDKIDWCQEIRDQACVVQPVFGDNKVYQGNILHNRIYQGDILHNIMYQGKDI